MCPSRTRCGPSVHARRAGHDLDRAAHVDPGVHGDVGPETAFLNEEGQPGADGFACGAPPFEIAAQSKPAGCSQRLIEETGIVAGIEQHRGREIGNGGGVGSHIGALVVKKLAVDREEPTRFIKRRANAVILFAGMVGCNEMLAPVLDPFHHAAKPQGTEAGKHILRVKFAPNAEWPS